MRATVIRRAGGRVGRKHDGVYDLSRRRARPASQRESARGPMPGCAGAPILPTMKTHLLRIAPALALLGGLAYAVVGAIELAHGGFDQNTHHTIDSTAEYLVTGGFAAALMLTAPAYLALGERAGRPRVGALIAAAQLVLSATSWISVIRGADAGFFDVVAPLCILSWLGGSIALAVALRRADRAVAYVLPALVVFTIPLAQFGGPLVTGAFWVAMTLRAPRVATA
jgi:hypothetical protein